MLKLLGVEILDGEMLSILKDKIKYKMIYIYGDSHAHYNLRNLKIPFINKYQNSITMFRIGRDNIIINFEDSKEYDTNILCYGEVDCRCHIKRQINLGRNEDDVINELVKDYINTIKNTIKKYKNIIIFSIIPPVEKEDYELLNGPITHEFPFVGSDSDRVRFTQKMNDLLKKYCDENSFIFFDPFNYYKRENGCLKFELSDKLCHIGDNSNLLNIFIDKFKDIF